MKTGYSELVAHVFELKTPPLVMGYMYRINEQIIFHPNIVNYIDNRLLHFEWLIVSIKISAGSIVGNHQY